MSKVYLKKIVSCEKCPNKRLETARFRFKCELTGNILDPIYTIPKDCPLKDTDHITKN